MSSIEALAPTGAAESTHPIFEALRQKLGRVPNMYRVMANSPAVLAAYTGYSNSLATGELNPQLAELIAVASAEHNGCSYCLSAHTAMGQRAGLVPEALVNGRQFRSANPAFAAALAFTHRLLSTPASLSSADLDQLREAGFSDASVLEIIAHVVRNMFTNYVNVVAGTEVDFPVVVRPFTSTVA